MTNERAIKQKARNNMGNISKVKEINIRTTDKSWWRMMNCDIAATNDKIIANVILAQSNISVRKIWGEDMEYIDNPVFINTANIIAIEVVRESEDKE